MKIRQSDGRARKLVTRVLATSVMLGMYAFGLIATTSLAMTAGSTSAYAQRGRGGGGGRGGGFRGGGRGRGGGGGAGAAVGLGIAGAIIGGAIIASQAEQARAAENAAGYCMRKYRSYNPETGTYIGRDGLERPCP
uniref:Lectin-like protein BA14k n=1 Tax=Rhodopseudomonas palustris (strain BisA53) TaxID=316055 RepID=Q07NG5_RHOP5